MLAPAHLAIDDSTFHADVQYIESLWRRIPIGSIDVPLIDIGEGEPLVFVPILEHLEFVYARQIRAFSSTRRVIAYRRQEVRTRLVGLAERADELRHVLDSLGLECVDLVGHGDAAMVLFEFALRYPQRCRSLVIIAQGADYQIAPHPFIWLLHDLFLRLPVEHVLPAWFLRRIVVNYIVSCRTPRPQDTHPQDTRPDTHPQGTRKGYPYHDTMNRLGRVMVGVPLAGTLGAGRGAAAPAGTPSYILPRHLIEEQFCKIALWPFVYKFSVLPIIHYYDMRQRLAALTMPILLINRADDVLAPEPKTRWLAENLPNCRGYHVVGGAERFFMYAEAEAVNQLIAQFLTT